MRATLRTILLTTTVAAALGATPIFAAPARKASPAMASAGVAAAPAAPSTRTDPFSGLKYRLVGPFRGGRASGVAGVAGDSATFYFGAATGGVWKTTDAGQTWKPLWDNFPEAYASVGAVAVAPSDTKTIYVGTGESNIRGNVASGNGLYKSTDGGKTWAFAGLRETRTIGRIIVDPKDANRVFVASLGNIFAEGPERGIFSTTDGGKTWKKVLYVDERTGGIDVRFDPTNPQVMWAGMWQAHRKPWIMESGGAGSGLYKSVDGGQSWTRQSGHGLPEGILGRINIAPTTNPRRIYAMIEAAKGGLYRSDDGGGSWALINDRNDYRQRAWYFNTVFADPKNPDQVYVLNTSLYRSKDGGKSFKPLHVHHGDTHELWIDPTMPDRMIVADDGGAEITMNGGQTWSSIMNQPTAQFYHIAADNRFPFRLYGDQQDNSSISIATAGRGGGVGIEDWYPVGGGESGFIVPDPTDDEVTYGGGYDAELTRYDHRTDETRQITPWPRNIMGWAPKDLQHRFQWTAPILVSRHAPHALYFGAEVLFRSTDQGQSWSIISPDLTRNDKSRQLGSGGPLTKDNTSVETYDTIFSVAESPVQRDLLWVGTDDGLVHASLDGGAHWSNVTPPAMPEWATVDMIEAGPKAAGTAYVAADRHRLDDLRPYAFRTHDGGRTWSRITDGLPADAYVHAVRADPARDGLLYAATERGVFASYDDGDHWRPLQLNLPVVPVHDLVVHGDALAVATHGRAFWIIDDLSPVRQWSDAIKGETAHLFTPAVANHTTFATFPGGQRVAGGANPPGGAVINWWLSPSIGKPRPAAEEPDGDAPKKKPEADPLDQRIRLEILDADGKLIRSYPETEAQAQADAKAKAATARTAATKTQGEPDETEQEEDVRGPKPVKVTHFAGINTFVWDLRYPNATAVPRSPLWAGSVAGPRALSGRYQVRLTVDGKSQVQPLEIAPDPRGVATPDDLKRQFDLNMAINHELTAVHRAVLEIREARARMGEPKTDAQKAAAAQMSEIEESLIQPRAHASEDALNFPVRTNNMIAALASLVGEGDFAPTTQDEAMFVELKAEADARLNAWAKLKPKLR